MFSVKEFECKLFLSFNVIKHINYVFDVFFSVGIFYKVSYRRRNTRESNCLK